ncbi:hypothetical protein TNCV_4637331 [Trichonephila clavipes]|nr:hypothetical protein TNCV_4637331 [Trichonephila clavipes]
MARLRIPVAYTDSLVGRRVHSKKRKDKSSSRPASMVGGYDPWLVTEWVRIPRCFYRKVCSINEVTFSVKPALEITKDRSQVSFQVRATGGLLATELVILNRDQVTRTTPELVSSSSPAQLSPPLLTTTSYQREDV